MIKPKHPERTFEAIAKRLIATREALNLEQNEFASNAGIPSTTYNNYEKAKSQPRLDFALALCDTYGLTLDWIYKGDASGLPYRLTKHLLNEAS